MRQEDKQIDGFELEREEELKADEHAAKDEVPDEGPQADREHSHTSVIASAMHTILEHGHIDIDALGLPQREQLALEALRTAVEARDPEIDSFVFATDRRTLLEQALAVLQPDLANLQHLGSVSFEEMWHEIAELRERLGSLKDAQFPLKGRKRSVQAEEGDKDADDDDGNDDTSLAGPEREVEKPASSLSGPERKDEPKPASSLTGPERKAEAKPPTTLGDPEEIAAAARPWWKR